jgi:quercetin 2,3-dioxygenase
MSARSVQSVHAALRDDIGDLTTRRPLPGPGLDQVDPFLFLNHHGPQIYPAPNRGLPFGPHPHRGFETVTFILAGDLAHHDSGGGESIIHAGGVQWMTAGAGLIHAEVSPKRFLAEGGPLELLQLWVNLPARLKFAKPHYVGLQAPDMPLVRLDDGRAEAQLVSAELSGARGPIQSLTGVALMTVSFKAGARFSLPAPRGRSVLCYVVRGAMAISGTEVPQWRLVSLRDDGDEVSFEAREDGVLLFGCADPIGEPVVAHGPFVMNTRDEIVDAIRDYQSGKFGAPPAL